MREASRRDNDGRQRNDEALARLYEEEKQEAEQTEDQRRCQNNWTHFSGQSAETKLPRPNTESRPKARQHENQWRKDRQGQRDPQNPPPEARPF